MASRVLRVFPRRSIKCTVPPSGTLPAVTVDAVSLAPSLVQPGQTATASVRIMNHGRVSSRATTANVFLATSDAAAPFEGTSVQTLAIGSLRPGASVSLPAPLIVPLVEPGAHYVIAQVDALTAVGTWTTMVASTTSTGSPGQPRKSLRPDGLRAVRSLDSIAAWHQHVRRAHGQERRLRRRGFNAHCPGLRRVRGLRSADH